MIDWKREVQLNQLVTDVFFTPTTLELLQVAGFGLNAASATAFPDEPLTQKQMDEDYTQCPEYQDLNREERVYVDERIRQRDALERKKITAMRRAQKKKEKWADDIIDKAMAKHESLRADPKFRELPTEHQEYIERRCRQHHEEDHTNAEHGQEYLQRMKAMRESDGMKEHLSNREKRDREIRRDYDAAVKHSGLYNRTAIQKEIGARYGLTTDRAVRNVLKRTPSEESD